MKTKSKGIEPGGTGRLLALVSEIPESSARVHLSDEEFADYTVGALSAREIARIDDHLALCDQCSREMEFLVQESAVWLTPEAKSEFRKRQESLLSLARTPRRLPGTVLWPSFSLPVAAATGDEVRGETEIYGCVLRYLIEEEGGNLIVVLASDALALEGRKVLLTAPGFTREITLNRVREDQVGAEITVERREREGVSTGTLNLQALQGE